MSENKPSIKSDLRKSDQHVITREEYDEIPELTDEMIDRADLYEGSRLIRRGRPSLESPKVAISIRFDADILAAFKATGDGWQTRMNDALREWLKAHPA